VPRFTVKDAIEEDLNEALLGVASPRSVELFNDVLKNLRRTVFRTENALEERFGPHDAMDQFFRTLSDRAHRETLLFDALGALVALSHVLLDCSARGFVAVRARLDQRNI